MSASFHAWLEFRSIVADTRDAKVMRMAHGHLWESQHVSPRAGVLVRVRGSGKETLIGKGHTVWELEL